MRGEYAKRQASGAREEGTKENDGQRDSLGVSSHRWMVDTGRYSS